MEQINLSKEELSELMVPVIKGLNVKYQSSTGETEQFRKFYNLFKRNFTKVLSGMEATNLMFHKGHFYLSGFFTDCRGEIWYFSLSDVRFSTNKTMLIRTAKSYKDYVGGYNRQISLHFPDIFIEQLGALIKDTK